MVPLHEAILAADSVAAIGGHVEGGDQLALVGQHLAAGPIDRGIRLGALVGEPAVGLVRLAGPQVEVTGTTDVPDRVGASGNRLRLERLDAPVGWHLGRHHALEVILHR